MADEKGFTAKTKPLPKGVLGFPPQGSNQNFSKESGGATKGGFTPSVGSGPFPIPNQVGQVKSQNRGKRYVIVLKAIDEDGDTIVREFPLALPEKGKITDLRAWTEEDYRNGSE